MSSLPALTLGETHPVMWIVWSKVLARPDYPLEMLVYAATLLLSGFELRLQSLADCTRLCILYTLHMAGSHRTRLCELANNLGERQATDTLTRRALHCEQPLRLFLDPSLGMARQ
jgi:hypothetical protein